MELKTLGRYYDEPVTARQLEQMAQKVVEGSVPHSLEVVQFLFGRIKFDSV